MLKRGNSDYQWYKARIDSLDSSTASDYFQMASNQASLNAETSQPQERADQHLPQKSYADAVTIPEEQQENGAAAGASSTDKVEVKSSETAGNVNGFSPANGSIEKSRLDDKVVYEKYTNDRGDHLTSVKPDESYEKGLQHDREIAKRDNKEKAVQPEKQGQTSQLRSGRLAGAGWERSAYVLDSLSATVLLTLALQHPMGTSQCTCTETPADLGRAVAHSLHHNIPLYLLPSLRYATQLATSCTILHLYLGFQQRSYERHSIPTVQLLPPKQILESVRFILSS